MTEFPLHQPVCSLWVRSALPLICDAEASIRDAVTDSFYSNLLLPAQAVGCASDPPGPAAEEKAGALRAILGAIAGTASSVSCLGAACKAAKAKGLLRAAKVARAVELVIDGAPFPSLPVCIDVCNRPPVLLQVRLFCIAFD